MSFDLQLTSHSEFNLFNLFKINLCCHWLYLAVHTEIRIEGVHSSGLSSHLCRELRVFCLLTPHINYIFWDSILYDELIAPDHD